MDVLVRADASTEIGTGHVMRCLTLAEGLRKRGSRVRFVSEPLKGNINRVIRESGFDLATDMPHSSRCDWLIVDHYQLAREFETAHRALAGRLMVIDDLADRDHDCDLLLDQNLYPHMRTRYADRVPPPARLLLGPAFALLRDEFARMRDSAPVRRQLSRVLVFFGGSDPTDEISKTLRALAMLRLPGLEIQVVVGAANFRLPHLEAMARPIPGCHFIVHTREMARLMSECDLFIGAGGSTSWERCCLGVPSLVIAVAQNQVEICRALADAGVHTYLGWHEQVSADDLAAAVRQVATDFEAYAAAATRGRALVDGAGVTRVIDVMEAA